MATLQKCIRRLVGMVLAAALFALPSLASATTYYVSTGGNDANDGLSSGTAWKTITHAAATVPAGTSGAPNVITVAGGTYNIANTETFPINLHAHAWRMAPISLRCPAAPVR